MKPALKLQPLPGPQLVLSQSEREEQLALRVLVAAERVYQAAYRAWAELDARQKRVRR